MKARTGFSETEHVLDQETPLWILFEIQEELVPNNFLDGQEIRFLSVLLSDFLLEWFKGKEEIHVCGEDFDLTLEEAITQMQRKTKIIRLKI